MKLVNGGGDIVSLLEEALTLARSGKIDCISVCVHTTDKTIMAANEFRQDAEFVWARCLSGLEILRAELMEWDRTDEED